MTSPNAARADALAWLTGRLQWERLLSDLHDRVDDVPAPVDLTPTTDDPKVADETPAKAA